MAAHEQTALLRQAITLASLLGVLVLVIVPSSAPFVVALLVAGSLAFVFLSSQNSQKAAEVPMLALPSGNTAEVPEPGLKAADGQLAAFGEAKKQHQTPKDSPVAERRPGSGVVATEDTRIPLGEKQAPEVATPGKAATQEAAVETGSTAASQPQSVAPQGASAGSRASVPPQAARGQRGGASDLGGGPPLAGGAAVLARLRQQRAQSEGAAAKAEPATEVVVGYASQTGTAHEIAKGIQAESASHGIKAKVMSLNELGFEDVQAGKAKLLVLVAASTGDGDPPDNAAKFYATMRKRTQELGSLKGVKFTCLGLGDSNYTRFMGVSRALRSRLQELGAEPFYKMAEADEVDGIENTVDPWVEGLWAPLKAIIAGSKADAGLAATPGAASANGVKVKEDDSGLVGVPALPACRVELRWLGNATETAGIAESVSTRPSEADLAARDPQGMYSPAAPFWAPVTAASYLTAMTSDRKVLHMELDLAGSGMRYQPGDSLGVSPLNDDAAVDALLSRLGADGSRVFEVASAEEGQPQQGLLPHLGCPATLRRALQAGCDITSPPRKLLLRLLAEHCLDSNEGHELLRLSSRGGREAYNSLISSGSPSLLDLLLRAPSCKPPLAALLDALPPLAPRLYSVASSPLEHGETAHIAFSVVRIGSPARPNVAVAYPGMANGHSGGADHMAVAGRWGVATGWLERQVEPLLAGQQGVAVRVPVHLRRGGAFRLPEDVAAPVIMIGPGTGVTPFRGFLQHRRQLCREQSAETGPAWLYFGCRGPEEDFLYKEELQEFAEDGTLSRFEVCFSRAGPEKVYVQQRMLEQARELFPLLTHEKAFIFVCGDGANMAKDVHAALATILEQEGGMSSAKATAQLSTMTKAGRYIRDIWS